MYDMYHWHRIDAATDDSIRHPAGTASITPHSSETHANGTRDGDARRASRGTRAHRSTPAPRHVNGSSPGSGAAGRAVQAVQVALDRRDNGGDLAATRGE